MKNITQISFSVFLWFCIFTTSALASAPFLKQAIHEALEIAAKTSGKEIVEVSAREAGEQVLEKYVSKYGQKALSAVGDGGLELIEASARYGDDVMKLAVGASPAARRALALKATELLPIARRIGPEAIELEAKAPGLAIKACDVMGDELAVTMAKSIPGPDIPRLLKYAEMADSSATRRLLIQQYQKEGVDIFRRIPPGLVIATGLTASMLLVANDAGNAIRDISIPIGNGVKQNPDYISDIMKHGISSGFILLACISVVLMWRFGLMPWHRKKDKPKEDSKKNDKNKISK